MRSIIKCRNSFNRTIVISFYVDIIKTEKPYGFITYMREKIIIITIKIIAQILRLNNVPIL
jgi:hypothetical protein